jgi:hypothetical protein
MRRISRAVGLTASLFLAILMAGVHPSVAQVANRTLDMRPGSTELTPAARQIVADIVQDQVRDSRCTGVSVSVAIGHTQTESNLNTTRYKAVVSELIRDGLPAKCLDGPTYFSPFISSQPDQVTLYVGAIAARHQIYPVIGPALEIAATRIATAMGCEKPEPSWINIRKFSCREKPLFHRAPELAGALFDWGKKDGMPCLWFSTPNPGAASESDKARIVAAVHAFLALMHVNDPDRYIRDFLEINESHMIAAVSPQHLVDAANGAVAGCFKPGADGSFAP